MSNSSTVKRSFRECGAHIAELAGHLTSFSWASERQPKSQMSKDINGERQHWRNVMKTMLLYEDFLTFELQRRQSHVNALPKAFQDRLPQITFDKFGRFDECMRENQLYFREIVKFYVNSNISSDQYEVHDDERPTMPDKYEGEMIPIREQRRNDAVLHSSYRDWSKEGEDERKKTFQPIIQALIEFLPVTTTNLYQQRVLVPGYTFHTCTLFMHEHP